MTVDLTPGRDAGLRLSHPVLVAAGGAGFGSELLDAVGTDVPGVIITRSVTRAGGRGDAPPRMAPLTDGLVSSVGHPNPGLEAMLRRHGPRWAASDVPVVVSLCGETADDIAAMARIAEVYPEVAGIELNLACRDRSGGAAPIGLDVEASETATVAARAATELPLIVKLTASAPDPRPIARAVAAAGADAISAVAPLPAVAMDAGRRRPALGSTYGGLSGPALKSVALRVVFEIAQVVRVPVIGIGGVSDLDDVLDYLAAGATAVGLATAALADPTLPGRLGAELDAWLRSHDVGDPLALRGTALPQRRDRGSLRGGTWRA